LALSDLGAYRILRTAQITRDQYWCPDGVEFDANPNDVMQAIQRMLRFYEEAFEV
jgi:hypothetical protein